MTPFEEIRRDEREKVNFAFVQGLWKKGLKADFIADALNLPIKKVEKIIQKIKSASN